MVGVGFVICICVGRKSNEVPKLRKNCIMKGENVPTLYHNVMYCNLTAAHRAGAYSQVKYPRNRKEGFYHRVTGGRLVCVKTEKKIARFCFRNRTFFLQQ